MGEWLNESGFSNEKVMFRSRSAEFQMTSFFLRKRNCGISSHSILYKTAELQVTDCSVCESRTAELQDIVYSLYGSETAELQVTEYSLCGGGFKVKDLVWKRNRETSSRTKLLYGSGTALLPSHSIFPVQKRNSAIAQFQNIKSHTMLYAEAELWNIKSQYIPCAEAELRKFKPKNIPCADAELQNFKSNKVCVRNRNFKSHNILYVESLWFLMQ